MPIQGKPTMNTTPALDLISKPRARTGAAGPRRLLWQLLGAGSLLLGSASVCAQAINDVPMAVQNNVAPNFMFMLDSSGSMSHIVPSAPYSAANTYSFSCAAADTIAAGSLIQLSIANGGIPEFIVAGGGTSYRHVTVQAGAPSIKRCFSNTGVYPAQLVTNRGIGSTTGSYTGHFLNWYFGTFDGPETGWVDMKMLTTGTVKSRWDEARNSSISVISGLPVPVGAGTAQVRVGLSTYADGGKDGGALKVPMADLTAASRTTIMGATIPGLSSSGNQTLPSGSTPLATTLADIGRYMSTGYNGNITAGSVSGVNIDTFLMKTGTDAPTATKACLANTPVACNSTTATLAQQPIQSWCQRSYAFLVTDGRPTFDRSFNDNIYLRDYDGDCQGALAANCVGGAAGTVANWDRKTARLPYESVGGTQVGSDYLDDVAMALFDIDLRPDLTAPGGRAKKNNVVTYTIGFADETVKNDPLLMNTAKQGGGLFLTAEDGPALTAAFSKVVTDAFSKDAAAAAVAVANAQITLNNIGYASSYRSGSWYGDLVAYSLDPSTALQTGSNIWSLRQNLATQSPSTRKIASYNGSTGKAFTPANFAGTPSSLTTGVINYIRGDRTGEGSTYRQRQDVLGDIINAEPAVLNYGGSTSIIFQGANDGMLHVVDGRTDAAVTTRGQELWAYVPRLVHGNLAQLSSTTYSHLYFVDGTPATADSAGMPYARLLVGGLGKGGRGYYALDVSNYDAATEADVAAKVLWEFSPANMGYSFGTPLIVKTAAGWRVVVTSGYDNGSNSGGDGVGRVWVIDPTNVGAAVAISTGAGTAGSPAGLAHLGKLANSAPDALVRYVYGGDLLGNVWRFDLDASTATKIAVLTDNGGTLTQPVTSPPEVGAVAGNATRVMVYLGTGRYLADEDVPGTAANAWAGQQQSIYGLLDDTAIGSPTVPNLRGTNGSTCPSGGGNGDLVCQALSFSSSSNTYQVSNNAFNPSLRRGWYIDFPLDPRLTNGRVIGRPALTSGGTLTLTVNIPTNVQCDPGGSSWFLALNAGNGGEIAQSLGGNNFYDAGYFLGYALGSRPVIVTTANGRRALIRMSDKSVVAPSVPEAPAASASWRRIYWREVK
jgi:type IV pilus assembly protein PilY1